MKHRVWDEVCCEFNDGDTNYECDDKPEKDITLGDLQILLGYFNGGRHVYLEVKGPNKAVKDFEEAFLIVYNVYEPDLTVDGIAKELHRCTPEKLDYLKMRETEYNQKTEQAEKSQTERQAEEKARWTTNEWYDLGKLVQAALDAGWEDDSPSMHAYYKFVHYVDHPTNENKLKLTLTIDGSMSIVDTIWVCDSVGNTWPGGGTTFAAWNMRQDKPYVQNLELIERWLGIPTPQQAVAALKQVEGWNQHVRNSTQEYNL